MSYKLSGPEKEFQDGFLPKLMNGKNMSLSTFYKSPENQSGSLCRGVKVSEELVTNFFPDWLLELTDGQGKYVPVVVETKATAEVSEAMGNSSHPTHVKALDLVALAEETGIKAGLVYKDSHGNWNVITGVNENGFLESALAVPYFTE